MTTGGADGPARPDGTGGGHEPDSTPDTGESSAPWERPRRWAHDRSGATRVEDLLARLSLPEPGPDSRRHRRDADDTDDAVAAGDLIAALSAETGPADAAPDGPEAATGPAPDQGETPDADDQPPGEAAARAGDNPEGDGALPGDADQPDGDGAQPGDADQPDGDGVLPEGDADQPDGDGAQPGDADQPKDADAPDSAPGEGPATDDDETTELPVVAALPGQGEPQPEDVASPDSSWESVLEALRRQTGAGGSRGTRPPPPVPAGPAHADHPHRAWWVAGRSAVAVLAVLLLLITGTEWVIKSRADAVLADRKVSAIVPDDTNISTPTVGPTSGGQAPEANGGGGPGNHPAAPGSKTYQAENILLMGSDTRATKEDAKLGGSGTKTMQSDVLMVAHLSADRTHVTVVSIPRDLYIQAPTCKAWDYQTNSLSDRDYVTPYSTWKITNAYSVGGPQCTVRAVQKLTGLRIDRVIIIDFAGFRAMVNALGGITVNACRPIIDTNPGIGTVLPRAGRQHINGTQALKLVRARHVIGDTRSDLARIHRQQKVLSILLRQASSAGVLLNPAKLNAFLQAFVHHTRTDNVTLDDLLNIAQSLGNLNPDRVTFYTLPTVPSDDGQGLEMTTAGPKIWNALVNDQALPGEITTPPTPTSTPHSRSKAHTQHRSTSPSSTPSPTPVTNVITRLVTSTPHPKQRVSVAPGTVNLQVVNVAGRPGVATLGMNSLDPLGFDIGEPDLLLIPGDVRQGITVEYSPGHRPAAVTVAAAVPRATLVRTPGLGDQVRLMLGSSFDGTVRSVSVGSPVPSALSTTAKPVVSTVLSTQVSTPSPPPESTSHTSSSPTTSTSPSTSTSPTHSTGRAPSLSDVESVNAGNKSCI